MNRYQKIGILGGMGPDSTADFFLRIIGIFQKRTGASFTTEFPAMTIESITFLSKAEAGSDYEEQKMQAICRGCRTLEKAGVNFIVIPCNSAHKYIHQMRAAVKIEVLSIIEETAKEILNRGMRKVLLFATEYTVKNKLYAPLQAMEVELVMPDQEQQGLVTEAIKNVFAGKKLPEDRKILTALIHNYQAENKIDGAILGCTELPLILDNETVHGVQIFDTLTILAESTFTRSTGIS